MEINNNTRLALLFLLVLLLFMNCVKSSREGFITIPKQPKCSGKGLSPDQVLVDNVSRKIFALSNDCNQKEDGVLLEGCGYVSSYYKGLIKEYQASKKSALAFEENNEKKKNKENKEGGGNGVGVGGGSNSLTEGQRVRLQNLNSRLQTVEMLLYQKGGLFTSKEDKEEFRVNLEKIMMI